MSEDIENAFSPGLTLRWESLATFERGAIRVSFMAYGSSSWRVDTVGGNGFARSRRFDDEKAAREFFKSQMKKFGWREET